MRSIGILVMIAALAALPGAHAMDAVTVDVPDVSVWVDGQTVKVDSSEYASDAPALTGQVQTKDVDLHINGPTCTIDPTQKVSTGKVTRCQTAEVDAPESVDAGFVDADIGLRFGSLGDVPAEQQGSSGTEAAQVQHMTATPTVLLAAAAAGASLLGLYAVWRALKWTGLFAFLPLYSHISDDEILDDANRASIYRLIQSEAGISTKDIADTLDLAWGTVTHHLGKLEKRRFVVSKKYGKYRRYFANGHGGTEQKDQVAVLRLDRTGDVAALIRAQPGLTQKAVSTALGVSSSTILWHVKRLEGAHLITKVREGKLVRYYPGEGLDSVLVAPPAAPTANAA